MADSKIRVEITRGYTVLQNEALRDPRLSFKARGLLAYMLSLPPEWNFSVSGLSRASRDGKDAIRSALRELEAAGYLVREAQAHDEGGKFAGCSYVLHDVSTEPAGEEAPPLSENPPTAEAPLTEKPTTDKPTTDKPTTENPTQINTYQVSTYSSNNTPLPPKGGRGRKAKPQELDPEVRRMLNRYVAHDPELTEAMQGLMELRVDPKSKAKNTPRAIRILLSTLTRLSGGDRERKIAILQQSVTAGWVGVFPLRGAGGGRDAPRRRTEEVSTW